VTRIHPQSSSVSHSRHRTGSGQEGTFDVDGRFVDNSLNRSYSARHRRRHVASKRVSKRFMESLQFLPKPHTDPEP